ncbi:glycoside hydrolase family 125 protein [Seonamhaeicola sediminis]|uniref:Glycoside hydrolase family 125 protein n=1 Tax=Seonamhaeicola sediminis TaxID=2528206 RepID=A0A562YI16_9FLAO|nr:glycoside hydrolase family 125 protein [Seonamhaeicola sediminis]TWO34675.1 glycoside hydrolase family 125 protein [Seonamhaeicola sediminis]
MDRREFSKKAGLLTGGVLVSNPLLAAIKDNKYVSKRPPVKERLFTSEAIEKVIVDVKKQLKDHKTAWLFENCFPNTLDTTVYYKEKDGKPFTYIITGDIDAMWLRDCVCQVWPYMPYLNEDEKLKRMIAGLINQTVKSVIWDPYACCFYDDFERVSFWSTEKYPVKPGVHHQKWEINSLLFVIRLCDEYYKITKDTSPFDDVWEEAMLTIVKTLKEQQRFDGPGPYKHYRNYGDNYEYFVNHGYGRLTRKNGMIHATHRQDDPCILPLYVPDNLMAIVELKNLAKMFREFKNNEEAAKSCELMRKQIRNGVEKDAIIDHEVFGKIFAFEVDGYGGRILEEESTVPNLMNLPYIGYCDIDYPVYQNTRKWLLSEYNPQYIKGQWTEGIGSTHYPQPPQRIWPLSTISRALTTEDDDEIKFCLDQLRNTDAGTGFIHESYVVDDPEHYTRSWFAWVNSFYGEMILKFLKEKPHLLT